MKIYFVTNCCGGLPQRLHETESLDVVTISAHLSRHGHLTEVIDHADLIRLDPAIIRGSVIIYASSQYPELYQYIEHCLLYAEACGGHLLPNYHCFRAHENKFVQELLKKQLGLTSPRSRLYGTIEEISEDLDTIEFPAVLKYPHGFASAGVSKIDSAAQLMAVLRESMVDTIPRPSGFIHRIIERRQYNRRVAAYANRYPLQSRRIILQEFIGGLGFDWKVLVFGNRFFCLKRYVRAGDFRASGSGNFEFDAVPPEGLLEFARDTLRALDSPWASFDIAEKDGRFYLIEFQCVHFGPVTLMRNTCYYSSEGGSWARHAMVTAEPEPYFGDAAVEYLAEKFPS